MVSHQTNHIYEFGPFRLDAGEHLLLRDGEAVPLTPKAFDLLLALVERHGHLLEKDELLKKVWPDTFVEEDNLASNISQLRKTLGDGENGHRYIETAPKRGYRFVASVREIVGEAEGPDRTGSERRSNGGHRQHTKPLEKNLARFHKRSLLHLLTRSSYHGGVLYSLPGFRPIDEGGLRNSTNRNNFSIKF